MLYIFIYSYMSNNPYKRNDRFSNNLKNGSNYNHLNQNATSPGPPKVKMDRSDDGDKPKRNIQIIANYLNIFQKQL